VLYDEHCSTNRSELQYPLSPMGLEPKPDIFTPRARRLVKKRENSENITAARRIAQTGRPHMGFLREPCVAQLLASLLLVLRHYISLHRAQTLVVQCSILLHRPQTGRSHMVFLRKPRPHEDNVAAAMADLNVHSGAGANAHPGPAGTVAVTLETNPAPGSDEVCLCRPAALVLHSKTSTIRKSTGIVAATLETNPAPGSDEVRVERQILFLVSVCVIRLCASYNERGLGLGCSYDRCAMAASLSSRPPGSWPGAARLQPLAPRMLHSRLRMPAQMLPAQHPDATSSCICPLSSAK